MGPPQCGSSRSGGGNPPVHPSRSVDVASTPMTQDAFQVYQHPPTQKFTHDPLRQPKFQGRNRRGGGAWSSLQGPARHWASVVLLMSLKAHGHRLSNHKRLSWGRPTEEGLRGLLSSCASRQRRKQFGKQYLLAQNCTSKYHSLCFLMAQGRRSSPCWNMQKKCCTAVTSSCV